MDTVPPLPFDRASRNMGTAGAFSRAGCTASDREEGTVTSKGCRATGRPAPALLLIAHLFAPRHPASFLATSSSARLSSEPDTYKMVAARQ